jgi:hypothetical protein
LPYSPPLTKIDPELVGNSYHIALGSTTPGLSSPDRIYGYMLREGTSFEELNDIKTRDRLVQTAGPNLIDQNIVNTPRITDGDFSGGMLQVNWLSPNRYWDSDLDIRTPGELLLNPAWDRKTVAATGATRVTQVVNFKGDPVLLYAGHNIPIGPGGNLYSNFGSAVTLIDTDGPTLYASDGVNNLKSWAGAGVWNTISSATGPILQMWCINQGTSGHFIYYTPDNVTLLKVDLSNNTIGIAVPLGGTQYNIVEVVSYLAGVAILTNDSGHPAVGFDLWYHDGQNLQHIIRVNGYTGTGMCAALGTLYLTARSTGGFESPILASVSAGEFLILARADTPELNFTLSITGGMVSSGQYVYFTLSAPKLSGIAVATVVLVYDVLSGALWHYGNLDANDFNNNQPGSFDPQVRRFCAVGRAVVVPEVIGGQAYVRYQANQNDGNLTTAKVYAPSGWLFSSRFDANTPGIDKLWRRLIVHHTALNAGESVLIKAFLDTPNPTKVTTSTAPVPAGATITNATVGSTSTVLTMPSRSIAPDLNFALQLTAGTSQLTSPIVYYVNIELSVSWTWRFTVDCSSRIRMLNGEEDQQGLRGKDLYFLVRNAWEAGQPLTFHHPNGQSYNALIEEAHFESLSPHNVVTPEGPADLEGYWTLTLRDAVL